MKKNTNLLPVQLLFQRARTQNLKNMHINTSIVMQPANFSGGTAGGQKAPKHQYLDTATVRYF